MKLSLLLSVSLAAWGTHAVVDKHNHGSDNVLQPVSLVQQELQAGTCESHITSYAESDVVASCKACIADTSNKCSYCPTGGKDNRVCFKRTRGAKFSNMFTNRCEGTWTTTADACDQLGEGLLPQDYDADPPVPDGEAKIGVEIEFKPATPYVQSFVWSNAVYHSDLMPELEFEREIGTFELDITTKIPRVKGDQDTENELSATVDGETIQKMDGWVFEVLALSARSTLKTDMEGKMASSLNSLMTYCKTQSGGSSKTVTMGDYYTTKDGSVPDYQAYKVPIVQGQRQSTMLLPEDYFKHAKAYMQANVDMTVDAYMTKIEGLFTAKWHGRDDVMDRDLDGIELGMYFKYHYMMYQKFVAAAKAANGDADPSSFEKLVLWFLANSATVHPSAISGISGRFKNPFLVMPKMDVQELAKKNGHKDKKSLSKFLDGVAKEFVKDDIGWSPKKDAISLGVKSEVSKTGVAMFAKGPLKELFKDARENTGDFFDCPAWSKQMKSTSGQALMKRLGTKNMLIAEFRLCKDILELGISVDEGGVISLELTTFDEGMLFG